MSYSSLIAIIDSELERLQRARDLLTSTLEPPVVSGSKRRKLSTGSPSSDSLTSIMADATALLEERRQELKARLAAEVPKRTRAPKVPKASPVVEALPAAAEPMPASVAAAGEVAAGDSAGSTIDREPPKRRMPRVKRVAANTKGNPALLGALGGSVPEAPVYVSANQLRTVEAQKKALEAIASDGTGAALGDMPTAEMLSRRWLTGSAN